MPDPQQAAADSIRVDVPNLGTIEFPSGTSEADMKKAIDAQIAQSHVSKQEPVPHPIVQRMLEWLPAVGGAAGGVLGGIAGIPELGVGAIPGAIIGAATGGAAGRTAQNAINSAIGNPAPKSIGEAFQSVGNAGLTQGATEAVGSVAAPVMGRLGAAMMQSAVKPGLKATVKAVSKGVTQENLPVVKTMLKEGINVTPGGIKKLNDIIGASNKEIADAIANTKGWIYPEAVADRLGPLEARMAKQVNPASDVANVKDAADQFLASRSSGGMRPASPMSVAQAQEIKQGTYRSLGEKAYGELKGPQIEAQKTLARGLKEDIESEAMKNGVDISKANAREGAALTARDAVAKRVAAAGNRDAVSLAWLAAHPTTGILFVMERSPAVKSMLARGLYKSASVASKVPENVIRTLMTAIASAQDEEQ